jgi:MFS family permease
MARRLISVSPAFAFVLTMGVVNLFGDITYEGGGAINGPFLGSLGASALAISITAGAGEFLGYALRLVAGFAADKTGRYWPLTFLGYVINLLAVPAMALAPNWQTGAGLILAERTGRAIRKPTTEAMLSYTTGTLGRGWVYAVNSALDETGATIGPLLMVLVLFLHGSYRTAFALLLISSVLTLMALSVARIVFPLPSRLEQKPAAQSDRFTPSFWVFMLGGALFASGLMSYELISFYFASSGMFSAATVPLLLAFATGFGVLANLVLGRLYDRFGLWVLNVAIFFSALFAPLVFTGWFAAVLLSLPLWGIGYAVQDTLLKALVAGVLPKGKRSFAFGLFYAGYGCGWLLGSIAAGILYSSSHAALAVFAALVQISAIPVFIFAGRLPVRSHAGPAGA